MTIRKDHTSFLIFYFWYLKLVPIDSALNSSGMVAYVFKQWFLREWYQENQANLKIQVKIFLKRR